MRKKERKLIIIGLDGATFDLIVPWAEEGKLKTFARLLQEGNFRVLQSVLPPYSAAAWSSFMTGKNPGKHGVVDFHYVKQGSYNLSFCSSRDRDGQTFWDIAGNYGKRVGVINVPITYPPDEVNGFMVSGLGAPGFGERTVYPAELFKEIRTEIGDYIVKLPIRDFIRSGRLLDCRDVLIKQVEKRYQCMRYLMSREPWSLLVAVFSATDHAQHYFWKYMDPAHPLYDPEGARSCKDVIYSIYKLIDSYLREIIEGLDSDTDLFIMSDHGFKPNNNKGVYLNNWLNREGFLEFRSQDSAPNSLMLVKKLISIGKRYLPSKIKSRLKRISPVKSKVETISRYQNIDWRRSVAYADPRRETIRLNLKGREPMGVVDPTQYDEVRELIIQRLREFRDPETGEKVFTQIFHKEEVYWGPYAERAPDIICLQAGRKYVYALSYLMSSAFMHKQPIRTYTPEELSDDPSPNAVHSPEGIMIAWGESIKQGGRLAEARITDIAPTVLYLMGLPVPTDMDGRVLTEVFEDSFLQENKVRYEQVGHQDRPTKHKGGYTEAEEEEFKKALENLGYL